VARRDDILGAVFEAERLHKEFDTKARVGAGEGRIDVFEMLVSRDIPVIFRPLETLLGAYIKDPGKGIIVTSQRSLPIQRFTAAHELGHEALGHEASLDPEDILTRALFVTEKNYDRQEIQANAFASQLLTPSWLIAQHMTRQGWSRNDMVNPATVYQLSLRMGSSYSATCYALADSGAIGNETRKSLLAVQRKAIKRLLAKPYEPENWYGDVWLVTDRDNGLVLEGSRSDLVVLKLAEHASSGYLWQFGDLADAGLAIKEDGRSGPDEQFIGGLIFRTVIAEPRDETGARGHVHLREVRPWESAGHTLKSVDLEIELLGPAPAGLLLEQREALLGIA
jgi:Zn-dependent peptidase ImmA (M78 family)